MGFPPSIGPILTWAYGDSIVIGVLLGTLWLRGADGLIWPKFYTFFLRFPNFPHCFARIWEGSCPPPPPPDSYAHAYTSVATKFYEIVLPSVLSFFTLFVNERGSAPPRSQDPRQADLYTYTYNKPVTQVPLFIWEGQWILFRDDFVLDGTD